MTDGSAEAMTDVVVWLDPDDERRIEERLEYGDAKSAWIREAVKQRLERESTDN